MMESLYQWIRQIAYYMILVTAALQVTAGKSYQKYIRFFTRIVLVLLILTPVAGLLGIQNEDTLSAMETDYETAVENMQEKLKEMEQETGWDDIQSETEQQEEAGENSQENRVEVEEIRIGR
jgi:stage III sporulation protein AF